MIDPKKKNKEKEKENIHDNKLCGFPQSIISLPIILASRADKVKGT